MTTSVAPVTLAERAAVHAALGDEHRLAIVDALVLSDRSPSELAEAFRIESNLLAHHLDVLARAGVIERVRSSGDGRRRYLRLVAEALSKFEAVPHAPARSVLFVCTENSARSQFAAAIWNASASGHAESAGTHPAARVHPLAVATAARHGLDLSAARPCSLAEVSAAPDVIVTVCDRAHEELTDEQRTHTLHWSVPDPADEGTALAFERAFAALQQRVDAVSPMLLGAA